MKKETVLQFYFLSLISKFGISFIAATYVTFLISNGLNLFQVNLVNMVYFGTNLLFEIPTGAIADIFGRKFTVFLSGILHAAGMFIYAYSHNFAGFALAEALAALGATCFSGAYQAWFVDKVKDEGYKGKFNFVFAKSTQINFGVGIAGALAGSFLADYNQTYPWIIGGIIMLLASMATLIFMKEETRVKKRKSIKLNFAELTRTIKKSASFSWNNKAIRFLILLGLFQSLAIQAPNMQWQPFYILSVVKKFNLGLIWAAVSLALMLGAYLSNHLLRKLKNEKKTLVLIQTVIGVGIMLAVIVKPFFASFSIFLIHEMARGAWTPVKDAYLNDNISSSNERASIISCQAITTHIGSIIGLLLSGWFAFSNSISISWITSGAFLVIATMVLVRNGKGN